MRRKKGAVTLEFALFGTPVIFALISIVEMSRGMWIYQSQAYAVNVGVRYVTVHGAGCTTNGNSCSTTVDSIATVISKAGVGLVPSAWNVTLYSNSGTNNQTCNPLSSCFGNSTVWPPSPDNAEGNGIAIAGSYPFNSALAMFFPGARPTSFSKLNLPAYAQHLIQF